ncbi:hypothetical protein [Thermogutta sp.]|uniref:DF family (seleno)protein n=1 Tax=Thermogutta sp. TaxID=1962930 RepID=UPI00322086E7
MKIEVLYFEGCPNHKPTVERTKDVLQRLGVDANIHELEVTQNDDPMIMKFAGSPTVLIDGQDIDPRLRAAPNYGFGCRTYGGAGVPPVEMIEAALREACNRHDCGPSRASPTDDEHIRPS